MEPLRVLDEREQIEVVFGLLSGELEKKPWEFEGGGRFTWWYEGIPEYAKDEPGLGARNYEYATAITEESWGPLETPWGWERVARYTSSGEAPHPDLLVTGADDDDPERTIYLGEGWGETVYRRPAER
jgi:hypothetical protein